MKHLLLILMIFISFAQMSIFAQKDRKYIREGNKAFASGKYQDAELSYRKALDKTKEPVKPSFNIGDALYKQKKFEDAAGQFDKLAEAETNKESVARTYHNLGNSYLQANKLKESIEAYKKALRNNPGDMETKYNLAYAQEKLKEQQKKQQKNKDKNKDNKDNKDKNKNKKDQNKDQNKDKNKDQNKKDQDKKDQNKQDQNKNKDQQQKQQQPQPNQISKEDAARILQALANQEKDVQKKVKKAKAQKAKVKTTINW